MAIRAARRYLGDKLIRVAKPHRILDPAAGPLIAVKLSVLTRKTLGGLQTDLSSRVLQPDGAPLPGVYAAGEVAGFGGGGVHGYRALEGTFLGGCIFSGGLRDGRRRGRWRRASFRDYRASAFSISGLITRSGSLRDRADQLVGDACRRGRR